MPSNIEILYGAGDSIDDILGTYNITGTQEAAQTHLELTKYANLYKITIEVINAK